MCLPRCTWSQTQTRRCHSEHSPMFGCTHTLLSIQTMDSLDIGICLGIQTHCMARSEAAFEGLLPRIALEQQQHLCKCSPSIVFVLPDHMSASRPTTGSYGTHKPPLGSMLETGSLELESLALGSLELELSVLGSLGLDLSALLYLGGWCTCMGPVPTPYHCRSVHHDHRCCKHTRRRHPECKQKLVPVLWLAMGTLPQNMALGPTA